MYTHHACPPRPRPLPASRSFLPSYRAARDLQNDDVSGIFSSVGPIVSVRFLNTSYIVTFGGPHAAANAEKAVAEFDGAEVNGASVSVALDSGPPARSGGGGFSGGGGGGGGYGGGGYGGGGGGGAGGRRW